MHFIKYKIKKYNFNSFFENVLFPFIVIVLFPFGVIGLILLCAFLIGIVFSAFIFVPSVVFFVCLSGFNYFLSEPYQTVELFKFSLGLTIIIYIVSLFSSSKK